MMIHIHDPHSGVGLTWAKLCAVAYRTISHLMTHFRPQNVSAFTLLRTEIENPFELSVH